MAPGRLHHDEACEGRQSRGRARFAHPSPGRGSPIGGYPANAARDVGRSSMTLSLLSRADAGIRRCKRDASATLSWASARDGCELPPGAWLPGARPVGRLPGVYASCAPRENTIGSRQCRSGLWRVTGGHLGPAGWPSARDDHGRQTFNGPSEPMGYRRVRMMRRCERLTFADGSCLWCTSSRPRKKASRRHLSSSGRPASGRATGDVDAPRTRLCRCRLGATSR